MSDSTEISLHSEGNRTPSRRRRADDHVGPPPAIITAAGVAAEFARDELFKDRIANDHTRKNYAPEHPYDQFVMHGLPRKKQRDDIRESDEGMDCSESVMPVAFGLFPLENGTGGFKTTQHKRFYASVSAEVTLEALDGLSGGPIHALLEAYPSGAYLGNPS
jgi:hypothetical protein